MSPRHDCHDCQTMKQDILMQTEFKWWYQIQISSCPITSSFVEWRRLRWRKWQTFMWMERMSFFCRSGSHEKLVEIVFWCFDIMRLWFRITSWTKTLRRALEKSDSRTRKRKKRKHKESSGKKFSSFFWLNHVISSTTSYIIWVRGFKNREIYKNNYRASLTLERSRLLSCFLPQK